MSSSAANVPLFDEPYTINPVNGTISGVPLATWSSKSFIARWTAATAGNIESNLTASADRRLRGTITNRLPFALEKCALVLGRWAYPLDVLRPGETVALERLEPSTVESYLSGRT